MSDGDPTEILKTPWWQGVLLGAFAAGGAAWKLLFSRRGDADKVVSAIHALGETIRVENEKTHAALHGRFNTIESDLAGIERTLQDVRREGAEREARMTIARSAR